MPSSPSMALHGALASSLLPRFNEAAAAGMAAIPPCVSLPAQCDDVLDVIVAFMAPADIVALASTCRRMCALGTDQALWAHLVRRDFNVNASPAGRARTGSQRVLQAVRDRLPGALRTGSGSAAASRSGSSSNNSGFVAPPESPPPVRVGFSEDGEIATAAAARGRNGRGGGGRVMSSISSSSWRHSVSTAVDTAAVAAPASSGSALKEYKRLYTQHRQVALRRRKEAAQSGADMAALQCRFRLRVALDAAQFGCGLGLWPWWLVAWLALLLARVSGANPGLPWAAVWAPVAAAVLHPLAFVCLGACTECSATRARSTSALWNLELGDSHNLVAWAQRVREYLGHRRRRCRALRVAGLAAVLACLLAAPLLIAAKLDGAVDAPWGAVLAPAWVLLGLSCLVPFTGALPFLDDAGEQCFMMGLIMPFTLVIAAVLGVTCALLEGHDIRLVLALIPFWIVDALLSVSMLGMLCAGCLSRRGERRVLCATGCALLVLLVAAVTGQALASVYWDAGDRQSAGVALLVPALLVAVLAAVAASVGAVVLLLAARRDHFSHLYRRSARWAGADVAVAAAMPAGHGVQNVLHGLHRAWEDV